MVYIDVQKMYEKINAKNLKNVRNIFTVDLIISPVKTGPTTSCDSCFICRHVRVIIITVINHFAIFRNLVYVQWHRQSHLNLLNISIKLYFDTDKWTQVILSVSGFQTMTLDPKVRSQ